MVFIFFLLDRCVELLPHGGDPRVLRVPDASSYRLARRVWIMP
jgi:hypothetical protein